FHVTGVQTCALPIYPQHPRLLCVAELDGAHLELWSVDVEPGCFGVEPEQAGTPTRPSINPLVKCAEFVGVFRVVDPDRLAVKPRSDDRRVGRGRGPR